VTTRVTFLGDTLVGGEAQPTLDVHGPRFALDGIRPLLARSDLVVANLEGPITCREARDDKADTGRKRYWYRAQPESTVALREAGIRVVSLANNHILDYGEAALADTKVSLEAAGIQWCGAGTRSEARRPAIVTLDGVRFGFVSYMQRYDIYVAERLYATKTKSGPLRLNLACVRRDLQRLKERADVRIVLVHWGRNYRKRNPRQIRLAAELRAAGADAIVGHHPHVPQAITVRDNIPAFYSLGNGPLGTPGRFHSGRPPYGLVVSIDFDSSAHARTISVQTIFVDNSQVGFQPQIAADADAHAVLRPLLAKHMLWEKHDRDGFVCHLPEQLRR
jgi:poly-gamma-glutamate synthesis protein (capsule biosynthesis protein)